MDCPTPPSADDGISYFRFKFVDDGDGIHGKWVSVSAHGLASATDTFFSANSSSTF
jgi:hypothetical protein